MAKWPSGQVRRQVAKWPRGLGPGHKEEVRVYFDNLTPQWKPISECFFCNVNYVHKIRNINVCTFLLMLMMAAVHGICYVMICTIVHSELHELSLQFVMYNHGSEGSCDDASSISSQDIMISMNQAKAEERPVPLKNYLTGEVHYDSLHHKSDRVSHTIQC